MTDLLGVKKTVEEQIEKWIPQKELAKRWHVSPGTIINWRQEGRLPFFRVPGTSKILYPGDKIIELENKNTTIVKEGPQQQPELKRKKPVMSAKPIKEWRI